MLLPHSCELVICNVRAKPVQKYLRYTDSNTCMHISRTYTCTHTCTCAHVHVCVHMHTYARACARTHRGSPLIRALMRVHMCACMSVCVSCVLHLAGVGLAHPYLVHAFVCVRVCVCVCMCMCMCAAHTEACANALHACVHMRTRMRACVRLCVCTNVHTRVRGVHAYKRAQVCTANVWRRLGYSAL